MLEQLGSQMKGVLEAVTGAEQRLDAKIDAVNAGLTGRIDDLTDVVRQNSKDIRKNSEDIRKNSEDIRTLSAEFAGLRHGFDHREERGRVSALEARVSAIETRLTTATR